MELASGKRLHNYIKSPFLLMGKSSINGVFSIAMLNYQRVTSNNIIQHQIFFTRIHKYVRYYGRFFFLDMF